MARYMLTGIEDNKWRRFKADCDLQGITIKQAFLEYIDITIETLKKHPADYMPRSREFKKGGNRK